MLPQRGDLQNEFLQSRNMSQCRSGFPPRLIREANANGDDLIFTPPRRILHFGRDLRKRKSIVRVRTTVNSQETLMTPTGPPRSPKALPLLLRLPLTQINGRISTRQSRQKYSTLSKPSSLPSTTTPTNPSPTKTPT